MIDDGWVGDVYLPKEQRAALLAFADAIGAKRKLGADEAGNPRIEGKWGRVYVQPSTRELGKSPKFQLYFFGHWNGWRHAREAFEKFAVVTSGSESRGKSEGAGEGIAVMSRLPTPDEGEIIRDKLGIFKRVVYSDEVLAAKREQALAMVTRSKARAEALHDGKINEGERDGEIGGVGSRVDANPPTLGRLSGSVPVLAEDNDEP